MAIISTLNRRVQNVIGDRRVSYGKFGNVISGAEINTGLKICEFLFMQGTATVGSSASYTLTEDLPRGGSAVPVISNSVKGGNWFAYGR